MTPTHWTPGIIVLIGGLVAGVIAVLLLFRRSAEASGGDDTSDRLKDLDERYRQRITQLRELRAEAHIMDPATHQAEVAKLEQSAAAILRERDGVTRASEHDAVKQKARADRLERQRQAAANSFFGRNPTLKGALIGGGVIGFAVVLGLVLTQETKPAQPMAQPGPMRNDRAGPAPEERPDPQVEAAMKRLESNPEDLESLSVLTHDLIGRQQFPEAEQYNLRALSVDPFHVESRVHAAVLRGVHGEVPAALDDLLHVADTYPDSHEALIFAGMFYMQGGRAAQALEMLERYSLEAPPEDQPPTLPQIIAQLRAEVGR